MAHPDMNALLDEGLRIAAHLLEKNGEFFPFGVTISTDGKINHVQGYTGEDYPPSQDLINLLLNGFLAGAKSGDYRATSLVCDTHIFLNGNSKTDAINVIVEHVEDEPVTCFLPYTKNGDTFEFGEILAERAERRVFGV